MEAGTDEDTTDAQGGGLILTGINGICETTIAAYMAAGGIQHLLQGTSTPNSAGLSPGPDGDLDSLLLNNAAICATMPCDDALDGTRLTVTGVTDVSGNTIRTTGDEFFSDGSIR